MKFLANILKTIDRVLAVPVLLAIRIYQKLFSFDHAFWASPGAFRVCIYHPSCSEFTFLSIKKFGLIRGGLMGTFRVLRCNPLSTPGLDPVPEKFSLKRSGVVN